MTPLHSLAWAAIFSFLASSLQASAAEIRSLTLKQAVELALERNPTLQAQALTSSASMANEVTVGLRPNPGCFTDRSLKKPDHERGGG